MRIGHGDLTRKALLSLEELLVEVEKGTAKRSLMLRFTLAYLYSIGKESRYACDEIWRTLAYEHPHSEHCTRNARSATINSCLNALYLSVGLERTSEMMFYMLKKDRET